MASTTTHNTQIYLNGKRIYQWPISTGRPGDNTPNGTYLTIDKGNPVNMKGPGYNLEVPWSVRCCTGRRTTTATTIQTRPRRAGRRGR